MFLESWMRRKMSNTKCESRDRNICRIGCGRPGQRDYGWKGPAFNCCFGTVACLVEHKRPVRHASVAWTCEYLPVQWNAPLSPHLPYKPQSWPSYSLRFQQLFFFGLTHLGALARHTHAPIQKTCWDLSLFLFLFAQVQSLGWCNDGKGERGRLKSFLWSFSRFSFCRWKGKNGTYDQLSV